MLGDHCSCPTNPGYISQTQILIFCFRLNTKLDASMGCSSSKLEEISDQAQKQVKTVNHDNLLSKVSSGVQNGLGNK